MPLCSATPSLPPYPPHAVGPSVATLTFSRSGDFAAYYAAGRYLEARGFSVGLMQAHAPSGILFGDFAIGKWRNLHPPEREALHGKLTGPFRDGPITVHLFASAPPEAHEAFAAVLARG